jgi:HK97 family phage prohead protease
VKEFPVPREPHVIAREGLQRSVPFALRDDVEGGDGLTLDGYAAAFNSPTMIDSWEGTFEEQIAPGAFRKSLRERTPRLQFDHGRHPLVGSIPLGVVTEAAEDDRGLHVVARLSGNWLIEPVRDAIADGAIDGMSFRFTVVRDEWHDAAGKRVTDAELEQLLWQPGDRGPLRRTLREVKVSELGPVVWPAYDDTSVGVRDGAVIDLRRLSEPAQRSLLARALLMADAGEASKSQAQVAPRGTEPAAAHAPSPNGTPRATDPTSAGEHVTTRPRGMRPIDLWVRKARDTVLTIDQRG